MDIRDELIDHYGYMAELFSKSYEMMGRLLDRNFVKREVEKRQWSNLYIYGGGYLGLNLYFAIIPYVNVLSIVDKSGKLKIHMKDVPTINMDDFKSSYCGEPVIITPIQYYREIHQELQGIVTENNMIYLEEFGVV